MRTNLLNLCMPIFLITAIAIHAQSLDNLTPKQYTNLTFTSTTGGSQLRYSVYPPAGYRKGDKLPVLLYMHGTGPRSTWSPEAMNLENYPIDDYPFFLIEPYCPTNQTCWTNTGWNSGPGPMSQNPTAGIRMTYELIRHLVTTLSLDSNRIYIHGNSNGGYATWDMLARWPTFFAAALPVCGAGDPSRSRAMVDIPIWAWHSADDDIVPFVGTRIMIDSLLANGGWPRYEYLAGYGHYAWNAVRERKDEVFAWMFAQERKPLGTPVFTKPLENLSVVEGDTVILSVDFAGSGFLTWKKNGVVISGQKEKSLPLPRITLGDAGTTYACEIINTRGSATTAGTLSVSADTVRPKLIHITTGTPTTLTLVFSEAVDVQSATTPGNYTLDNGATVSAATIGRSPFIVELTTSTLVEGRSYRLTISGVKDRSAAQNTVAPGTAMDFVFNERQPGLKYTYYRGLFPSARFLYENPLHPFEKEGIIPNFDITGQPHYDSFGYRFSGYILISAQGTYTFHVTSDDGSLLYINNTLLIDNDGSHGMMVKSGKVELAMGYHAIDLYYFQGHHGLGLIAQWEGPGILKQNIPDAVLRHSPVSGGTDISKPSAKLPDRTITSELRAGTVRQGNATALRIQVPEKAALRVSLYDIRGALRYSTDLGIVETGYVDVPVESAVTPQSRGGIIRFARIHAGNRVVWIPVR